MCNSIFPGKVRLGSLQMVGLVDLLGKEAVGYPLFLDRGITYLTVLGEESVGFSLFLDRGITYLTWGKVRLGSVQMVGFVDLLGEAAVGFHDKCWGLPSWFHEHSTHLAELGVGIHTRFC